MYVLFKSKTKKIFFSCVYFMLMIDEDDDSQAICIISILSSNLTDNFSRKYV